MVFITRAGFIALSLNLIMMTVGYYIAKYFASGVAQRKCISLESGLQNGTLAVFVYHKYEPINEEAACKVIEMFNSEKAKGTNFYEYDSEPRLETSNQKGSPELGYNSPFNYVAAGAYPKKVNIGIAMSNGYFMNYDNQDEHVKQIWDAIRFSDAQQKLNSILK